MGPKTKSAHLLRWHYGDRVTMGQFSNSFPKHFSYLCEYAFRFDLSCSICEYPFIFHCLHCSPSCFDPDSLLLAHLWLGLSWIYCISANKSFSSPKTSSRKPYTSSKQQERQKHNVETTINFSSRLVLLRLGSPVLGMCACNVVLCLCFVAGWVRRLVVLRLSLPVLCLCCGVVCGRFGLPPCGVVWVPQARPPFP